MQATEMIAKTRIPVVISSERACNVASKINNMMIKTQPSDKDKIPIIQNLITKNIDIDGIRNALALRNTARL